MVQEDVQFSHQKKLLKQKQWKRGNARNQLKHLQRALSNGRYQCNQGIKTQLQTNSNEDDKIEDARDVNHGLFSIIEKSTIK